MIMDELYTLDAQPFYMILSRGYRPYRLWCSCSNGLRIENGTTIPLLEVDQELEGSMILDLENEGFTQSRCVASRLL
jgi:hypothetical protein